jgi:RNA polymerase sigma-70 factor (ECF subfamily)
MEVEGQPSMPLTEGASRGVASPSAADLAMDRYAEGNDAAFAEVFALLAPRIQAFLRRLSGSDDLAGDLTQETFLRMHRARGSFGKGQPVVPWAYAIARNCFVSHTRSGAFRHRGRTVDVADHPIPTGGEASSEDALSAQQTAQVVARALDAMSPTNREAFVLVRFEGLSIADAAEVLGTTQGAVKIRAFRAYEALRRALHECAAEPEARGTSEMRA